MKRNFSVIGLTETRILKNKNPILDFSIPGYKYVSTPTESTAGGVLLYVSDSISFKPRHDLTKIFYQAKNLESVFIEIIVPKKPNIIVGTIYRHPNMPFEDFNSNFLKPLLFKINKENKQTILLGDFNINLLNSNTNSEFASFLDTSGFNLIVPQILLPTRITKSIQDLNR